MSINKEKTLNSKYSTDLTFKIDGIWEKTNIRNNEYALDNSSFLPILTIFNSKIISNKENSHHLVTINPSVYGKKNSITAAKYGINKF